MTKQLEWLLWFGSLVVAAGCDCGGTPPAGPCDTEDDCPEGQTCRDGVCELIVLPDGRVVGVDADFLGTDAHSPADAGTDSSFEACALISCTPGQRCELADDGSASCVNNTCGDLACSATERCLPHAEGGNVCEDFSCSSDISCAESDYCDGVACQPDICSPGASRCDGNSWTICASNGGAESSPYSCGSPSPFVSSCIDDSAGLAACDCEGDWDCPAHTACEVGRCSGTGVEPTCTLDPIPFAEVPPAIELHWGGDSPGTDAHDGTPAANPAPWPQYGEVMMTPTVANLDDDNGDGLINELDFPEILFIAHQGDNPWGNGVVRAIHGGGVNKGADYFARCGTSLLWTEETPVADTCASTTPDADSGAAVAVADLDYDGVPEIVYTTESNTFRILDNTGALLYSLPSGSSWDPTNNGETVSVANLDGSGFAEIIVGRTVYRFDGEGAAFRLTHVLAGTGHIGVNGFGQMTCPADLLSAFDGQEIVAGTSLYRLPDSLPTCGSPPCTGALVEVWDALDIGSQSDHLSGEGLCAIADIWGDDFDNPPGPDNAPDGVPEIVLIDDGDLSIIDSQTGTLIDDRDLGGGSRGGAPNVDDFDGDGFMEVASALQNFYVVVDLQESTGAGGTCPDWPSVIPRDPAGANPNSARTPGGACDTSDDCAAASVCNSTLGQCVCLHNGWRRDSDDDSSRATSSSVFDFNGDGAAEVLYNDECDFRVYDGATGEVLFSAISRSRTAIENPIVADVDNDGNAEVVVGSNTSVGNRCDEDGANPIGPHGIRVWGDPTDTWVSARRIWNQQSYHIVNVTESASLPREPPASWGVFNGRTYNTYRSQPRNFGVAPDLTVVDVGISSPDASCGSLSDNIDIAFEIQNVGDLRVGPGVAVTFTGLWGTDEETLLDASSDPLTVVLDVSLEPGRSLIRSINYDQSYNGRDALPDSVTVVVDPVSIENPNGAERECVEDNNEALADVDPGVSRPDLLLTLGAASDVCPNAEVDVTVANVGSATATDVVVAIYAGDPSAGGSLLHTHDLGTLEAGAESEFTATITSFPEGREITLFGVADPADVVEECNNANNVDPANNAVICPFLLE